MDVLLIRKKICMCEDGEWLKVAQQQGLKHPCQGSGTLQGDSLIIAQVEHGVIEMQ